MTSKIARNILVAAAIGLAAPALAQDAPTPQQGGELVWGIETEQTTLNPQLHNLAKTKLLVRNAYEPLLARNAEGDYLPWLARGYEVSEDGKTYTITLRDDVVFSDGEKLTAEAVAFNYNNYKDVEYSGALGTGPIVNLKEARAVDTYTVELELERPYSPFLFFVSQFEIISPKAFESPALKAGGPEIAGTGPFILESYVQGQEITFARNPDYNWAPPSAAHQGPAYLDRVVYRYLPESSVRTGALLSGQVDVIEGVSGNDADLFAESDDFVYLTANNGGTPFTLFFNSLNPPTDDERVRRAVIASIDLDAVLQSIYRGQRTRAWGIVGDIDTLFYDASIEGAYGFDPALANRLLDEAGWTERDAEGFRANAQGERLTLALILNQSVIRDQREVLLQAIQAQLRQHAEVDFQIEQIDTGTFSQRRNAGEYSAFANSNTAADGYGLELHYLPVDQGGRNNGTGVASEQYVAWLDEAARSQDIAERFEIYSRLQNDVLLENAYALPLYTSQDQIAAGTHVHGLGFRPFHQLVESAYDVWIEQ